MDHLILEALGEIKTEKHESLNQCPVSLHEQLRARPYRVLLSSDWAPAKAREAEG